MIPSDDATDAPPLEQEEEAEEMNAAENNTRHQKKKKKKKRRRRKMVTPEEISAFRFVRHWVFPDRATDEDDVEAEIEFSSGNKRAGRILFELHSHSSCSDGFLSPTALVERAHTKGVSFFSFHCSFASIFFPFLFHFHPYKRYVCIFSFLYILIYTFEFLFVFLFVCLFECLVLYGCGL
jgi:hypothetical protein